ncbi:DUF461 domain-containing protein [Streptomyces sp. NPDC057445]|uniref:DUF461 domain-containing protein n=1 Tax=Streptomyces sp. NPDC057445 TaxID=3346136 RepID=UPI0036C2A0DA
MSRSLRRGAIAASALVISIASLTACAAGMDAQTLEVKPDNAATSVGAIKIQNATVVTQPEQNAEGPAAVSATVFNNGKKQQTLESITLPGTDATVKLSPAGGSGQVTVPAGGYVILGGKGNASAVIENGQKIAKPGDVQPVVLRFSETGDVQVSSFVVPADNYYKDFGPSGAPKPAEPSAPASASPSGSPSAGASTPAEGQHGGEGESEGDAGLEEGATSSESTEGSQDAGH